MENPKDKEKSKDEGGKVHDIKRKDQAKLPGMQSAQLDRLEVIEDELEELDGKIARHRKAKKELNAEAIAIVEANNLEGKTRIRGSNEWYTDEGIKKYKRRRFKVTKEDDKDAKKKATA